MSYSAEKIEFQLHKPPVFKEPTKDGQLVIYGENDKEPYPDYLIDLSQRSARHGAILKNKIRFICGNGWEIDRFGKTNLELYELQRLLGKPNEFQSFDEYTWEITSDYKYFGALATECVWNKAGTRIESFASVPVGLIRAVKSGDEFNFCYLPDWRGIRNLEQAKKKPGFKEWTPLGKSKSGSELLYSVMARPTKSGECNVYGLPDYVGGITMIEADAEIANFRLNNIKNGFWVSKIISFANGVPTLEEQKKIKDALTKQHQGSDNAGTWAMLFSDGGNIPSVLDMTGGDLDKMFVDVDKAVETIIAICHGVTSMAFMGVSEPGSLSQKKEIIESYELFRGISTKPDQNFIENHVNTIFSFNKVDAKLKLKEVGLFNEDSGVLNKLVTLEPAIQNAILATMSADELRELAGLKKKTVMSSEKDYILEQLESLGEFTPEDRILKTFELEKDEFGKYRPDDYYKTQHFASVRSNLDGKVIGILKDNPKATPEEIAKALDTDVKRVQKSIGQLIADELISGEIGDFNVPESSIEVVEEDVEVNVGIRYRYAGPKDSKNREFCSKLMSLSLQGKTYSRDELDRITPSPNAPDEKFSVFDYRGGFWTRKGTNITTAECRHVWEGVAVKL